MEGVVNEGSPLVGMFQAGYAERFANPYEAAARGYVDDVIDPRETRDHPVSCAHWFAHSRCLQPW